MTIDQPTVRPSGVGDKTVTLGELAVAYDALNEAKLNKNFSNLTALSGAPAGADTFAVEHNGVEYKIDYNALATAIISKLGGDPVTVAHGGTGATTAGNALTNLGAVAKSGDTMTGCLSLKQNDVDISESDNGLSSDAWLAPVMMLDKDGDYIGFLGSQVASSGTIRTRIAAGNKKSDGTGVSNVLYVGVDKSGNPLYSFSTGGDAAFRTAINAVNKSGDTMSGQLANDGIFSIRYPSGIDLTLANNGKSSGTQWASGEFIIKDRNGKSGGAIAGGVQSDGISKIAMHARNYNTSGTSVTNGGITIMADKSGNVTYKVDSTAAFRNAIGASSGVWPISLGGTGVAASNLADLRAGLQVPYCTGSRTANIDNLYVSGLYYLNGATATGGVRNDGKLYGLLLVVGNSGGDRAVQFHIDMWSDAAEFRRYGGSSWTTWKRFTLT